MALESQRDETDDDPPELDYRASSECALELSSSASVQFGACGRRYKATAATRAQAAGEVREALRGEIAYKKLQLLELEAALLKFDELVAGATPS